LSLFQYFVVLARRGVRPVVLAIRNLRLLQELHDMQTLYRQMMDWIYLACIAISAVSMVVMTLIIPYGVFTRYVLNSAAAWPEPLAVLLMVLFSFLGGAACYRANSHISVRFIVDAVPANVGRALVGLVDACMVGICLFMIVYGTGLAQKVWYQVVGEFPFLSVGITYLPIPLSGFITLLFIIEKLWIGPPPSDSIVYREPMSAE
jgi:TRAP-type C4-dicarboxylate transport system permease small subunit